MLLVVVGAVGFVVLFTVFGKAVSGISRVDVVTLGATVDVGTFTGVVVEVADGGVDVMVTVVVRVVMRVVVVRVVVAGTRANCSADDGHRPLMAYILNWHDVHS